METTIDFKTKVCCRTLHNFQISYN